jgi:hypothetical protein
MMEQPDTGTSPQKLHSLPRRTGRWIQILLAFVIFICGMVLGGSGALILEKKIILHSLHHPEEFPGKLAKHMKQKLGLTDAQKGEILEILSHRQERLQKLQQEVQPRFEAEFEAVQKEINTVLDPEQARKYNAWFDKVRKTWTPPAPREGGPSTP